MKISEVTEGSELYVLVNDTKGGDVYKICKMTVNAVHRGSYKYLPDGNAVCFSGLKFAYKPSDVFGTEREAKLEAARRLWNRINRLYAAIEALQINPQYVDEALAE